MHIIADDKIPYLDEFFSDLGNITRLPAKEITNERIRDADILLVRTLTHVDKELLAGSTCLFVGSPTAGTDHLHIADIEALGIGWANAPGCNANAVANYVVCCLAELQMRNSKPVTASASKPVIASTTKPATASATKPVIENATKPVIASAAKQSISNKAPCNARVYLKLDRVATLAMTKCKLPRNDESLEHKYTNTTKPISIGIIGVGNVGTIVAEQLTKLGFNVLLNDPPRALRDPDFHSTDLRHFHDLDIICLHTPLTKTGDHPTYHLIDNDFLQQLKPGTVMINAGRGAVIDSQALLNNSQVITCLDVWEDEPNIDNSLLLQCEIATPHIAGYSQLAKFRATEMVYHALCRHLKISPKTIETDLEITNVRASSNWQQQVLEFFNPAIMSSTLKQTKDFARLRRGYQFRQEFKII